MHPAGARGGMRPRDALCAVVACAAAVLVALLLLTGGGSDSASPPPPPHESGEEAWMTARHAPPEIAARASMGLHADGARLPADWSRQYPHRAGSEGRPHFLSVCSSSKDDVAWLAEWIEFQMLVGVDHVFLIDDESRDGTTNVIRAYEAAGVVTYIPGPVPNEDARLGHAQGGKRDAAYTAMCWDHAGDKTDWLVLMDTDEYMYPRVGCDLGAYIREACDPLSTHLLIRWEMHGSNGIVRHPRGLLAENFLMSGGDCHTLAPDLGRQCAEPFAYCGECRHTKFIANTGRCLPSTRHARNHWPQRLNEANPGCRATWVPTNGTLDRLNRTIYLRRRSDPCFQWWQAAARNGEGALPHSLSRRCCEAGIGLSHYSPKSREAHVWRRFRKQRNGLGNNRSRIPELGGRDRNEVLPTSGVMRFLAALRARVGPSTASPTVQFLDSGSNARCMVEAGWEYARDVYTLRESQKQRRGLIDPAVLVRPSEKVAGADPAACCRICARHQTCATFTWRGGVSPTCILHPHTPSGRSPIPVSMGRGRFGTPYEALQRRLNHQMASGFVVRDECPRQR
eukprot:TRINITY_DN21791_c0_g1_i1.p1 TRINITY_DN21791_c0_g1~~TRINITY_DN21791_c0_g1_i1.p1  ORF type:complete len:580 (+),score=124.74 TRINITY_DN21791_c0_g1_i1:37-1740(+)